MFIAAHRRSFRSLPWVALRCWLLLAAWQGPFPWCHSHAGLIDETGERLRAHLSIYHPGESIDADIPPGMHFHVEFPHGDEDNFSPFAVVLISEHSPHRSDPFEEPAGWSGGDGMACHQDASALSDLRGRGVCQRTPRGFFETFASDLALPLRLGIIRC